MDQKGPIVMSKEMLATVDQLRKGFQLDSQITVTQLTRSTSWKRDLAKFAVMQILDHNKTAAVVLTPDAYRAILSYIDMIEEELDSTQLEVLLKTREQMEDWQSGKELSHKAKESFFNRQEQLRGLFDGNKQ